jgi:hypothetical protein
VNVLVLVPLGQMQPHADRHHQARSDQLEGQRLMQEMATTAPKNGAVEK